MIVCRDGFCLYKSTVRVVIEGPQVPYQGLIRRCVLDQRRRAEAVVPLVWTKRYALFGEGWGLSSQGVCSLVFFGSVSLKRPGQRPAGALLGKRTNWG